MLADVVAGKVAGVAGVGENLLDGAVEFYEHLVEEGLFWKLQVEAGFVEAVNEVAGFVEAKLGGFAEAFGAHGGHVDAGAEGEEALIGADVAGGFFAADVLLAGLQSEAEGAFAFEIGGLADEAAGHLAQELRLAGEEAEVGPAELERD